MTRQNSIVGAKKAHSIWDQEYRRVVKIRGECQKRNWDGRGRGHPPPSGGIGILFECVQAKVALSHSTIP